MSAWYVLSAMGFYPSAPGTPDYSIGSPLFSRIVIHLTNGKDFTIEAPGNSATHQFVRSVQVNGRPRTSWSFEHNEILQGSTLKLEMSAGPAARNDER
jgi:putative alpha-1,2-mannosidase